MRYHAVSVKNN